MTQPREYFEKVDADLNKKRSKILILGAGGVGGYFGGRLVQAGGDVTFLVRPSRYQMLQEKGLRIKSPCGDATLTVQAITQGAVEPVYDYVFLTAKAYDLESAMEAVAPVMGRGAVLVPFLNGMTHMAKLNETYGVENVLGGVVIIQSTFTKEGVIRHFNDSAYMFFGEQKTSSGLLGAHARHLAGLFAAAQGVEVKAETNIEARMWMKWVQLSALAGMTCLMRANVGEIVRGDEGRAAMEQFLNTNVQLAAHYGYPLNEEAIQAAKNILLDENSTVTASMLRDLENGGSVEGDHILGDLLTHARNAGIAHPVLALAYAHIKAYEARRLTRGNI